jgi:PAS domain S-box-containing protein
MKNEYNLLLIEDNPGDARIISELLKEAKSMIFKLDHAENLKTAVIKLENNSYDIILLDLGLPDSFGLDTFLKLNSCIQNLNATIILTGLNDSEIGLLAVNSGAQDYLVKGQVDSEKLVKAIVYAFERNHLTQELKLELEARRVAEEELREKELQYHTLADSGSALIWKSGADKLCNYFNEPWLNFTGRLLEQEMGNGWAGGVHPDDLARCLEIYNTAFDSQQSFEMEYRLRNAAGEFRWIIDLGAPNFNRSDKFIGYIGHCFDITDRKTMEANLKESITKYQVLFDSLPLGITMSDKVGNIIESNQKAEKLLGLTKEEQLKRKIKGKDWFIIKPDGSSFPQEEYANVKALNENRVVENIEMGIVKGENEISWLNVTAAPIPHEKYGVVIAYNDITRRKKAEAELSISENRYRMLFDSIDEGFCIIKMIFDESGKAADYMFLEINPSFEKQTGLNNVQGKMMRELIPEHEEFWFEIYGKIALTGQPERFENYAEGLHRWYEVFAFRSGKPEENQVAVLFNDITERKNIELNLQYKTEAVQSQNEELQQLNEDLALSNDELGKAKEKAEESDRLKSAFLANMSHEIRTPMNGILGFTQLLKEPNLGIDDQTRYIGIIEKSSDRLLNIINDIIDISKIESGQATISLSKTNINEKIHELLDLFQPEVQLKGVKLSISHQLAQNDSIIKTDRDKVYTIFANLIKNAIKFTHGGSIEFGGIKKGDTIEFFVRDTGIGIRPDQMDYIFQRFRQGSESITRKYQGAGLGLSISKAYVDILGGKIWAESIEGKGSTFYFTIPCEIASIPRSERFPDGPDKIQLVNVKGKILKILIVEDDEASDYLITAILNAINCEISHVKNGVEAIKACRNNPDFDLVLMDIRLPDLDGYEATRQIRQFNTELIIIAQTAFAMEGDHEKAIFAGCSDYLTKPISKSSFLLLLKKYFTEEILKN